MKYKNPLLVVCDLEASIAFYREVLGLRIVRDFGANVTLTGGVCLQTKESLPQKARFPRPSLCHKAP